MFLELEVTWDQALVLLSSLWLFTMFSVLLKTRYCGMSVIRYLLLILFGLASPSLSLVMNEKKKKIRLWKWKYTVAINCSEFEVPILICRLTHTKSWLEEETRCTLWDRLMDFLASRSDQRVNMIALELAIALPLYLLAWVMLKTSTHS